MYTCYSMDGRFKDGQGCEGCGQLYNIRRFQPHAAEGCISYYYYMSDWSRSVGVLGGLVPPDCIYLLVRFGHSHYQNIVLGPF